MSNPSANRAECKHISGHHIQCCMNRGAGGGGRCCGCRDRSPGSKFIKSSVTRNGVEESSFLPIWQGYCKNCKSYWRRRLEEADPWQDNFPHSLVAIMDENNIPPLGPIIQQRPLGLVRGRGSQPRGGQRGRGGGSLRAPPVNPSSPVIASRPVFWGDIPEPAAPTPGMSKSARKKANKRARAQLQLQLPQADPGTAATPAQVPEAPARVDGPMYGSRRPTGDWGTFVPPESSFAPPEASAAVPELPIFYRPGAPRRGLGYSGWDTLESPQTSAIYPFYPSYAQPRTWASLVNPTRHIQQPAAPAVPQNHQYSPYSQYGWGRPGLEPESEPEPEPEAEPEEDDASDWEAWPSEVSAVPAAPTPIPAVPVPVDVTPQAPPPLSEEMRRLAEDISVTLELVGKTDPDDNAGMDQNDYKQIIEDAYVNIRKIRTEYRLAIARQSGGADLAQDTGPDVADDGMKVDSACIICCDEISDTVLMPCNHLVLCTMCSDKMGIKGRGFPGAGTVNCPICRSLVQDRIKIFRG